MLLLLKIAYLLRQGFCVNNRSPAVPPRRLADICETRYAYVKLLPQITRSFLAELHTAVIELI